jgi:hypothetical protein
LRQSQKGVVHIREGLINAPVTVGITNTIMPGITMMTVTKAAAIMPKIRHSSDDGLVNVTSVETGAASTTG